MKVVITENCSVVGEEKTHEYRRDQKVDLRDDAARHLIVRGKAVEAVDVPRKPKVVKDDDAVKPAGNDASSGDGG